MQDEVFVNLTLKNVRGMYMGLETPQSFMLDFPQGYSATFVLSEKQYTYVNSVIDVLASDVRKRGFSDVPRRSTPLKTRQSFQEHYRKDMPDDFQFMVYTIRPKDMGQPKLYEGYSDIKAYRGKAILDIDIALRTHTYNKYCGVHAVIDAVRLVEPAVPVAEGCVGSQAWVNGKLYFVSEESPAEIRRKALADAIEFMKVTGVRK